MLPAASKLYGKLSARSKLEALALIILLFGCVLTYQRGKHNGEAKAKVEIVERERKANADTVRSRTAKLDSVKAASDSIHRDAAVAVAKEKVFVLRPIPVLQTPANAAPVDLRPLVAELRAVVANRDSALVLKDTAIAKLERENAKLRIDERGASTDLITSLNRQIALDVEEINQLKRLKTPRFGVKAGIAVGVAATLVAEAGIRRLKKSGLDSKQAPDI